MLTIEDLKAMEPNSIFASGFGEIEHPWFNDATPVEDGGSLLADGRHTVVKWVAVRGGIYDWAIYHSMDANLCLSDYFDSVDHLNVSNYAIAHHGAKVHNREIIQKWVNCTEEALNLYRD